MRHGNALIYAAVLGFVCGAPLAAQERVATPEAVARESFAALKRQDLPTFAAMFLPAELEKFKSFVVEVFQSQRTDAGIIGLQKQFAPIDSAEKAKAASGADLLIALTKNTLFAIPGADEILASAEVEILGQIPEGPDVVHVIARTVLPRPQPVSCQKHDGAWRLLLNAETLQMMRTFALQNDAISKGVDVENLRSKLKLEKVEVLGHVKDGDKAAQVLCRVETKYEDFSLGVFGCYPVREGEAAWDHLEDKDQAELIAALRSKWGG